MDVNLKQAREIKRIGMNRLMIIGMLSVLLSGCASSRSTHEGAAVKIEDSELKGTARPRGTSGVSTGASGSEFNTGSELTPP